MDERQRFAAGSNSRKRALRHILVAGFLLLAGLVAAWRWWPHDQTSAPPAPDTREASGGERRALSLSSDPRLTFATPFHNVRPEVKYVGDQACARCHAELVRSYHQHPMGRSLAPVDAAGRVEQDEAMQNADFRAGGFHYRVEHRGNQVVHREMKEDRQGRVLAEMEAEVRFAVGSGRRGRTYLLEHDGYLFESPITWYPQKRVWDLSPGYAARNHHFARPVPGECLFCHSNYAEEVSDTVNCYRPPIFQGYAIGCERCHGPGELHVQKRTVPPPPGEEPAEMDSTIVNPRHLEPALRDSVCEQCHLQGEVRVLRRGRSTFDYRPGLPLHLFVSVFVTPPEMTATKKFVGHVEQMHASRCFIASAGKMGCSSCHDPHQLPTTAERAAYYRDRCLSCHAEKDCGLPADVRLQASKEDSCIVCHMPAGKSDIPHASITDHTIPRHADRSPQPSALRHLGDENLPLVHFHRDLLGSSNPAMSRDLGIALMDRVERYPQPVRLMVARRALPLLQDALQGDDDDVPAWEAKAAALWALGRTREAAAAFDVLLAKAPRHEAALHSAATLAMERQLPESARGYWERAIQVNPWRYEFHYGLAAARAQMQHWPGALDECQKAVQLNPFKWELRKVLVRCYLAIGARDQARREFERLLEFQPPEPEALRRWYAEYDTQPTSQIHEINRKNN